MCFYKLTLQLLCVETNPYFDDILDDNLTNYGDTPDYYLDLTPYPCSERRGFFLVFMGRARRDTLCYPLVLPVYLYRHMRKIDICFTFSKIHCSFFFECLFLKDNRRRKTKEVHI